MSGRRIAVPGATARRLARLSQAERKAYDRHVAAREVLAEEITRVHQEEGYSIRAIAEAVERPPTGVYELVQGTQS